MLLEQLFEKLGNAAGLTAGEKEELRQEIRAVDEVKNLIKSMIQPGTGILYVNGLRVAGGNVEINDTGIVFGNNVDYLVFKDTTGAGAIFITASDSNALVLRNEGVGKTIILQFTTTSGGESFFVGEASATPDLAEAVLTSAPVGARVVVGTASSSLTLYGTGSSSGATYIKLDATSSPPGIVADTSYIYLKGSNLIFKYNDGGTTRYKSLDLSGTGTTWAHATSEP